MFQSAENRALIINTQSFGELELIFFISHFLPLFLFLSLKGRLVENRQSNVTKERVAPRAPEPHKKTIPKLGPETRPSTPPGPGPGPLTLADALDLPAHEEDEMGPGPKCEMTIGDALGLIGRNKGRTDKKNRKWKASLMSAVSKLTALTACRERTAAGNRGCEGKPLISLRRRKRVALGEDGVCRVCRERNEDAAFVPCGHAYCRVCSREIWINRRSCPVCKCRILEVLDSF